MSDSLKPEDGGTELIQILKEQIDVLSAMLEKQRTLHSVVNQRNWISLEGELYAINTFSVRFNVLEDRRRSLAVSILASQRKVETDFSGIRDNIYHVSALFSADICAGIRDGFRDMKKLLLASKIENDSMRRYIETVQKFLQGLFDTVVPQRKNKIYSRCGRIVSREPESLVLNQSL